MGNTSVAQGGRCVVPLVCYMCALASTPCPAPPLTGSGVHTAAGFYPHSRDGIAGVSEPGPPAWLQRPKPASPRTFQALKWPGAVIIYPPASTPPSSTPCTH